MGTNKVKIGRTLVIGALVAVLFAFLPKVVLAIPMAEIRYVETNPVPGRWEYQYEVFNTSDPVADRGVNLNFVSFAFNGLLLQYFIPTDLGWIANSPSINVLDTYTLSAVIGPPSSTGDIAPGSSLPGFVLDFNSQQVGNQQFQVGFLNPEPPQGEQGFDIFITVTPAASTTPSVPEPATIILMTTGMGVLGFMGRKGINKSGA